MPIELLHIQAIVDFFFGKLQIYLTAFGLLAFVSSHSDGPPGLVVSGSIVCYYDIGKRVASSRQRVSLINAVYLEPQVLELLSSGMLPSRQTPMLYSINLLSALP